jgi:WD40 repeat protein
MLEILSNLFFVKILKLFGHPLKLFSENNIMTKCRFIFIIMSKYKMLRNKKKIYKYIGLKTLTKSITSYIFFPFYKYELRKKKFEIILQETRNLYFFYVTNICVFFIENSENKLIHEFKLPSFVKKKRILIDENNFISSCCFLKCYEKISFGFSSGRVKVFDIFNKKYILELKSSNQTILIQKSHPYINSLLFFSDANVSRILNFSNSFDKIQVLSFFQFHKIISCSFRLHGKLIDFSNTQNIIKSFDFEHQKWITRIKFLNSVFCITNNNNGQLLSIGKKEEIGIFDFRINKEVLNIYSKNSFILCTKWSNREYCILSSETKGIVSIWDLRNIKKKKEIKCNKKPINSFKIYSNLLLTCSVDKSILLWNYQTSEIIKKFSSYKKTISSFDISWSKNIICLGNLNKKIFLINL